MHNGQMSSSEYILLWITIVTHVTQLPTIPYRYTITAHLFPLMRRANVTETEKTDTKMNGKMWSLENVLMFSKDQDVSL
jgi:hypothetical protein